VLSGASWYRNHKARWPRESGNSSGSGCLVVAPVFAFSRSNCARYASFCPGERSVLLLAVSLTARNAPLSAGKRPPKPTLALYVSTSAANDGNEIPRPWPDPQASSRVGTRSVANPPSPARRALRVRLLRLDARRAGTGAGGKLPTPVNGFVRFSQ